MRPNSEGRTSSTRKDGSFLLARLAATTLILSGCGQSGALPAERTLQFYGAVARQDSTAACAALAQSTRAFLEKQAGGPCRAVILDLDLPHLTGKASVQVYGSMAQVKYPSSTTFLSRFSNGWRVTASGCKPASGDRPYDCTLSAS